MIICLSASVAAEPNYLRFQTAFDQDTDWCGDGAVIIGKGRYESAGYEDPDRPATTLGSSISSFADAAGFTSCYEYGGTYRGTVGGNPAEVQIARGGESFAIYIYYLD